MSVEAMCRRQSLSLRRDFLGRTMYRYHPNGWTIWRKRVEEDRRGWTPRGAFAASGVGAKVYWEVKRARSSDKQRKVFDTLTEARDWCDRHTGWSSGWPT